MPVAEALACMRKLLAEPRGAAYTSSRISKLMPGAPSTAIDLAPDPKALMFETVRKRFVDIGFVFYNHNLGLHSPFKKREGEFSRKPTA